VLQARINPKPIELPIVDADDVRFARLSTTQGLSQTRVQTIAQDGAGFLWFGTMYGLNRYDGYTFKVFAHDHSRSNSLGGVHIFSSFKDRAGYLWIGSDQTLDRLDPKTETFTPYRLFSPDQGDPTVYHIQQDQEGAIWLATGSGLFRLDPHSGKTTLFRHNPRDPLSLASNDVKSSLEDRSHRFWVATRSGLDEFDRGTGKVKLHVPISKTVREFLVCEGSDGLLWLGYASGGGAGLSSYDPTSNILSDYALTTRDVPAGSYTGVYAITEDHAGALWLGTGGLGLLKLDRASRRFLRYRHVSGDPDSISEDHITALLEDNEGNIWVGLNSKEPNYFPERPGPFRHVLQTLGRYNAGEGFVTSIFRDREGTLWAGSAGGLYRIHPGSGESTYYTTGTNGVSAGVIAIAQGPKGDLWLGTVGQGLKRFNPRTGHIQTYAHDSSNPNSLSDDLVAGLRFDGPDTLWVSTWDGLDRFSIANQTFTVYRSDPHARSGQYSAIAQDRQGMLWIASNSGLIHFNPRTSQFSVIKHADGMPTISNNDVTFPFIDSDGRLWVATRNGLNKLNADGTYTIYRERDGLGGNDVSCILEDDAGRLWLSTNRGLSRFDRKTLSFTNYSAADGLGDLTGWDSCLKTSSGELFFAGYSGLIAFYPEKVVESFSHAPIRFVDLRINGQSVAIGADSVLTKSIDYTDAITLSAGQRDFSLEFASLSFMKPGSVRYRYKMVGLNSQWTQVGSDGRVVSYSGLPSGSYTFRAQAAVASGPWTEPGVALRIQILPPWWARWEFRALAVAVALAIVFGIYRFRVKRIMRTLEIRFEERTHERARIARDLHDSLLQGIQGLTLKFDALTRTMPERSPARMSIEGNLRQARELIKEVRTRVGELRKQDEPKAKLEELLRDFGATVFRSASTAFEVSVVGEAHPLDPIAFEEALLIGKEAIANAMLHAEATRVEVELTYRAKGLTLRVSDNGKGLDSKTLESGRVGHWGLQGMRERAHSLGAALELWSRPGAGTVIQLIMPGAVAYGHRRSASRASGRCTTR
jgi:ligand-binding sensor domain-containing protein/signal transduction histidine kinase